MRDGPAQTGRQRSVMACHRCDGQRGEGEDDADTKHARHKRQETHEFVESGRNVRVDVVDGGRPWRHDAVAMKVVDRYLQAIPARIADKDMPDELSERVVVAFGDRLSGLGVDCRTLSDSEIEADLQ